jgi:hypothetical protein
MRGRRAGRGKLEGGKREAGGREEESWRAGRGKLEGGKMRGSEVGQ